ncbi:hypothetical protein OSB04_009682 [Centaurea solstitialis]|uniref:Uncharacterized protein n=1 Tax=Centaurea solstitialis TaxID=347529 RepID=A0AA38TQZ0_9ASTR|nr:hypothetical protein OSB04_009682 [Centaurea solstitialis]
MREDHHEIQTSKKESLPVSSSNRKAKSVNTPSKKLHHQQQQKSIKKSLSSVFSPITEEDVLNSSEKESVNADESKLEISETSLDSDLILVPDNAVVVRHPEESVGNSPISEAFVFDEDQSSKCKSMERYVASLDQFISPSSAKLSSVENTPFSSLSPAESTTLSSTISTLEMTPSSSSQITRLTEDGATTEETDSPHLESLVKHLRKSMIQVLNSADIDLQYKKLLDALVKVVIEEFCSLHEERDIVAELFSRKMLKALIMALHQPNTFHRGGEDSSILHCKILIILSAIFHFQHKSIRSIKNLKYMIFASCEMKSCEKGCLSELHITY